MSNFLTDSGLEYVGFVLLVLIGVYFFLHFITWFYKTFIARPLDVKKCGGDWALVTGATDGIGKAYTFALAKRGLNVILVSRTQAKLDTVAAEIESKYEGIQTLTVAIDFSKDSNEYRQKVDAAIQGLRIGVLVNNVGMAYDFPDFFLNLPEQMAERLIRCNIESLNTMTSLILPQMVNRKKGAVINIASTGGAMCVPLLSMYSGSKAYVDKFTEGLEYEYRSKGVTIQCILPGYVVSNMSQISESSLMVPTAKRFVESALSRLGIWSRTTGYWPHDMLLLFVGLLPSSMAKYFTFQNLMQVRDEALKLRTQQS